MKTTVMLQDDLYNLLMLEGKKSLSKKINEALYEHLVIEKKHKSLFGVDRHMAATSRDDIRDHYERDV